MLCYCGAATAAASMTRSLLPSFLLLLLLTISTSLLFAADATSTGTLVRHLSNVLKWTTKSSPKITQTGLYKLGFLSVLDGEVLLFEGGYLVETLMEGDKLGVVPHTIRVSPEGELFAVDATNNNIVRIMPPLSQYSRARLVAGSFQGYSGYVDGKPSEARFYHPKGVTMDDKGNVYVADTANLAIRKIGEAGVTTIAGGKSNLAGYRDGPSEDAKFSNDFDLVYVGRTCSLLVVDRGNAALRQISLQQEDCGHQYSSVVTPDIIMVIGAVLAGYVSCLLQHGFGYPNTEKMNEVSKSDRHDNRSVDKPALVVESLQEEPSAGWPSFGRLLMDLLKFSAEAIGSMLLNRIPGCLRGGGKTDLTPLMDRLIMPEDKVEPHLVQKQKAPSSMSETLDEQTIINDTPPKPPQNSTTGKLKDPSLSSKHKSSKRQEYADFYSSTEAQLSSKIQHKERAWHRHRDKSGEVAFGAIGTEPKSAKMNPMEFDHYNIRSKYGPDSTFRF